MHGGSPAVGPLRGLSRPGLRAPADWVRGCGMGKRKRAPYVDLYLHEIESPAYRSLSGDAVALLLEFRLLHNGNDDVVHMSVREVMSRCGMGQRRAQNAIAALVEHGWIRLLVKGSLQNKQASLYEVPLYRGPEEVARG